jgi:hypothetical protein
MESEKMKKGKTEEAARQSEKVPAEAEPSLLSMKDKLSESKSLSVLGSDLHGSDASNNRIEVVGNTVPDGIERAGRNTNDANSVPQNALPQKRMATTANDNGRSQKIKEAAHILENSPLPPEVWARVLDCCVYDDVARMARVSTAFLHGTMPLLTSLYIVNDGTFSPEANQVSRFQSGRVKDIYIDCTYDIAPDENVESRWIFSFTSPEPTAFIDFVAALPSVRNVFFGAGKRESKAAIIERLHLEREPLTGKWWGVTDQLPRGDPLIDEDESANIIHGTVFSALVDSYRSRRLRQKVLIYGLPSPDRLVSTCDLTIEEKDRLRCGICENFPVEQVWSSVLSYMYRCPPDDTNQYFPFAPFGGYQDYSVTVQEVLRRPGGREVIASTNPRVLLRLLLRFSCSSMADGDEVGISYMHAQTDVAVLRLLVSEGGLDPTVFHHNEILQMYSPRLSQQEQSLPYKFRESDFRNLVELGFEMGTGSFLVVPDGDFTRNERISVRRVGARNTESRRVRRR